MLPFSKLSVLLYLNSVLRQKTLQASSFNVLVFYFLLIDNGNQIVFFDNKYRYCDSTITIKDIILSNRFYRAMHFSAKRGIAIACRLSVCPSVCL